MSVNLDGVKETIRALRKIDPELLKEMNKEIKGVMIPIRDKARDYAPTAAPGGLYNWDDGAKDKKITARTSAFRESTLGGSTRRLFPLYNAEAARKGIYYSQAPSKKNRNGWQALYYVANKSAAGSIYETAGRASEPSNRGYRSNNPGAGAHFVSRMGPLYGEKQAERGRMIFRAWKEDRGKAQDAVVMALNKTISAFNKSGFGLAA